MKVYIRLMLAMMVVLLISACGQTKDQSADEPAILDVKIDVKSPIELQKKTEIACIVTYGKEKVNDADEVKFEIWKQGNDQHEMISAKSKGNGKYAIEKTFTEAGTYSVVAHVTARNMHNMPKTDVIVGDNAGSASEHEESGSDHSHHDDAAGVAVTLHPQMFTVNKEEPIVADIAYNGQPLTAAKVRFEIWKDQMKHEFIDANEQGSGKYQAKTVFKEKGTFSVKVHVETNELHEHQVKQVIVQ
ncbi:FixH family protein [Anoxybacteroides rupiense]|uniref:FixH family protein n=1 Tax=Anoxybacteroides rupiense TaxID=311460 RepID=UPI00160621A0|nr:FixH family protein [Anoxybacillus rupiensis]MBB3906392.1 hypothetical protein [Anoxybacillus rupiensis]